MDLKEQISQVLEAKKEIVLAYIYGSSVKGGSRSDSDLDIGILLEKGFDPGPLYSVRVARKIEMETHVDRELDVRILNGMPPRFLRQVIDGELIFSRDESKRVEFEMQVVDSYLDFKPFYEQYDQKRRERLLSESR